MSSLTSRVEPPSNESRWLDIFVSESLHEYTKPNSPER